MGHQFIIASITLIIGIADYYWGKRKLLHLVFETYHTIKEEWPRLLVLLAIVISTYVAYFDSHPTEEHYFHICLEFIGAIVLFLIVEHTIKKLSSGISDPLVLPTREFIADIKNAKVELVIFDTVLETIMMDDDYVIKFKNSIKHALKKNKSLSIRILILDIYSSFLSERANQLDLTSEEFTRISIEAKTKLLHIRAEIELNDDYRKIIQIREYKESPPFAMYAIDGKAYVGFFPIGKKSSDSRQLYIPNETRLGQQIFEFFYKKFDEIWKNNASEL